MQSSPAYRWAHRVHSLRGLRLLVGPLVVLLLALAALVSAANARAAAPTPSMSWPARQISSTPSSTEPYWACPHSICDAIVDPRPVKVGNRFKLPDGPYLEGSGELGGYDPQDLENAYRIPLSGGSTQTVAVVDAYGYPDAEADLAKYRERYGLPACTKASGCFRKINEHGEERNYPSEEGEWEIESGLDLDMVSAACPSCHIILAEAGESSGSGLAASVDAAVNAGATEVSNSYGIPEEYCDSECGEEAADYSHSGVVVTASSGDHLYDNAGEGAKSPSFPAVLPTVIAVGGTALNKAANSRGWSETVWSESSIWATGSGCSMTEPKPSWQTDKGCKKRMTNDVSAVASLETGVSFYVTSFGGWGVVGGTSVSSPLLAGMIAHQSEAVRNLGADAFYAGLIPVYDVIEGSNGTCPAEDAYFCTAELGYDGPTGLGTPDLGAVPPTVTSIEPNEGPGTGGTTVTVTGTGFTDATAVMFGGTKAKSFEVNSASSITTESPAGAGTVDITVETGEGTSEATAADRFTYVPIGQPPTVKKLSPKSGPAVGGTSVTITGTNFTGAIAVSFGGTSATSFKVNSAASITAVSPGGSPGPIDLTVSTPGGTSTITRKDRFKYKKEKHKKG